MTPELVLVAVFQDSTSYYLAPIHHSLVQAIWKRGGRLAMNRVSTWLHWPDLSAG